jgi:transcriptional regulator with XRE-family HTH domain
MFSDTIRTARTAAGLSQAQLGALAGITQAKVSQLESPNAVPSITPEGRATTARVIDALGLPRQLRCQAFLEGWARQREQLEGVPAADTYAELRQALEAASADGVVIFEGAE